MYELATIELDMVAANIVFRAPHRHIFLGSTGEKSRWIDTHKEGVSYEFSRGKLIVTAPKDYLASKELL